MQNKYYIIPSVNVDGVAFIERYYRKYGEVINKRTNMHIYNPANCSTHYGGVDLNRNYDYMFGTGQMFN